jgi:hypothetical protein
MLEALYAQGLDTSSTSYRDFRDQFATAIAEHGARIEQARAQVRGPSRE